MTALTPLQRIPPHLEIDDFLPADEHARLLAWAIRNRGAMELARIGSGQYAPGIRNANVLRKDVKPRWKPALTERIRALVPTLFDRLGVPPVPIHTIETQLVSYTDGCFVRPHLDTATESGREPTDRMLTAVYYFHREPKPFSGGELRLYPLSRPPEDAPQFLDLMPRENSIIAFSSWVPHEVLPVEVPSGRYADSRFAINFWVRRAPV